MTLMLTADDAVRHVAIPHALTAGPFRCSLDGRKIAFCNLTFINRE